MIIAVIYHHNCSLLISNPKLINDDSYYHRVKLRNNHLVDILLGDHTRRDLEERAAHIDLMANTNVEWHNPGDRTSGVYTVCFKNIRCFIYKIGSIFGWLCNFRF